MAAPRMTSDDVGEFFRRKDDESVWRLVGRHEGPSATLERVYPTYEREALEARLRDVDAIEAAILPDTVVGANALGALRRLRDVPLCEPSRVSGGVGAPIFDGFVRLVRDDDLGEQVARCAYPGCRNEEVDLRESDDDVPRYGTVCIIYGCGEPADGEGPIEFALPGGGTSKAHVCSGHRETLSENTLPYPRPRAGFTRPSAILRRPDPGTPISEATTAELLYEAHQRMGSRPRTFALGSPSNPSDEFERREEDLARARQATEDAISLHNRAVYRERGVFAITDAERLPDDEDR